MAGLGEVQIKIDVEPNEKTRELIRSIVRKELLNIVNALRHDIYGARDEKPIDRDLNYRAASASEPLQWLSVPHLIDRDPNYRAASAYEYGDVREFTLKAIVNTEILWSCGYTMNGVRYGIAGCTGPFEALAHALQEAQQYAASGKGKE